MEQEKEATELETIPQKSKIPPSHIGQPPNVVLW